MPVYKYVALTSSGGWTLPIDVNTSQSALVVAYGAGGGGAGGYSSGLGGGGGGGGGGYAFSTVSLSGLTAGSSVVYASIGAGGAGGTSVNNGSTGGDTWFNKSANSAPGSSADGVIAKGGALGQVYSLGGGLGGGQGSNIGSTVWNGGNGGVGNNTTGGSGGGGGSAGSAGANGYAGGAGRAAADGGGGGGGGVAGAGSQSTTNNGGNGGLNQNTTNVAGSAGAGASGTLGGGGAGGAGINFSSTAYAGGQGGAGTIYTISAGGSAGPGGGGGGGGGSNNSSSTGGLGGPGGAYGGGGGGGGAGVTAGGQGGAGANGAVVFIYVKNNLVSISTIQSIFGGSNPASLSEYRAGGAYVPDGYTIADSTDTYIKSSGTIPMSDFTGTVALTGRYITVGSQSAYDYYGALVSTDYGWVGSGSLNNSAALTWFRGYVPGYGTPLYSSGAFRTAGWTTPGNTMYMSMYNSVVFDRFSVGKTTFNTASGTQFYSAPAPAYTQYTWSTSTNPFVSDGNRSRLRVWVAAYPNESNNN